MKTYKDQALIKGKDVSELRDTYRITLGTDKERALLYCENEKIKEAPYALTTENNRYYLWI